jgi:hypothetical protein
VRGYVNTVKFLQEDDLWLDDIDEATLLQATQISEHDPKPQQVERSFKYFR